MVNHYKNLFTTTAPILDDSLNDLVDMVVTYEDNSILCPSLMRLRYIILSLLCLNKAPGLDGNDMFTLQNLLEYCEASHCCFYAIFLSRWLHVKGIQSYLKNNKTPNHTRFERH